MGRGRHEHYGGAMFIRQIDAIKDINCAFIETRKGMKLI